MRHHEGFFERSPEKWSLTTRNSSNKTMKSKLIILSIATLLGCVSCHTIGGVGKDVEAVGSDTLFWPLSERFFLGNRLFFLVFRKTKAQAEQAVRNKK